MLLTPNDDEHITQWVTVSSQSLAFLIHPSPPSMAFRASSPLTALRSAFLAMLDDFERRDPTNAEFYAPARDDFTKYVQSLLDEEKGIDLRDGWVPCTHRWLLTPNNVVAGVSRLRHRIDTPFLREEAGHIGYDIAPLQRGNGYGHGALRIALDEAVRLGLPRVLLYTSEDNAASRIVIERAGGVLEAITYSEFWNQRMCKYWIRVCAEGQPECI